MGVRSSPSLSRRPPLSLRLAILRAPPQVVWFHFRAWLLARRLRDRRALRSSVRLWRLSRLVQLARGRTRIVEIGTAAAWTACALVVSGKRTHVASYDPSVRPNRSASMPGRTRVR